MRNTLRQLERRIDKLAQRLCPPVVRGLIWRIVLEPAVLAGLGPEQRIVEDQYEDAEGSLVMTWERVTSDPSDIGQCFPYRFWNSEALKEFAECNRHPTQDIEITWKRERLPEVTRKGGCKRAPIPVRGDRLQPIPLPENGPARDAGADQVARFGETGASNGEWKPKVGPIVGSCELEDPGDNDADALQVFASEDNDSNKNP